MMRAIGFWVLPALAAIAYGCSGDDESKATPCPEGVMAGQVVQCDCGDAGVGTATCQDDKTLTECGCGGPGAGAGGGGTGGTSTGGGGTGGNAGAPGGGSGGGGGGGMPDEDAGMPPPTDGGMTEPPPTPIKMDGSELALCEDGTQCGVGLDCYGTQTGAGYCAPVCEGDPDCASLGDGWECFMAFNLPSPVCRRPCEGADDTSCPDNMECMQLGGGFPGGGGGGFVCNYPANAGMEPGATDAFGECMGDEECGGMGAVCIGDSMGGTGFCTVPCADDTDCEGLSVSSGNIDAATCEFAGLSPMPVCALNCDAMDAECPDGMMCNAGIGPFSSQCGY